MNGQESLALEYPGYSEGTADTLNLMDLTLINYDLVEEAVAFIDEYGDEGAILIFLPGLGTSHSLPLCLPSTD